MSFQHPVGRHLMRRVPFLTLGLLLIPGSAFGQTASSDSQTLQALLHEVRQLRQDLLAFLLPLYDAEGKAYISVAVGCTGGRHRSVAIANSLAAWLRQAGREVNVNHRDVEKVE